MFEKRRTFILNKINDKIILFLDCKMSNEELYNDFKNRMKEKKVAENIIDKAIKIMQSKIKFGFFSFRQVWRIKKCETKSLK